MGSRKRHHRLDGTDGSSRAEGIPCILHLHAEVPRRNVEVAFEGFGEVAGTLVAQAMGGIGDVVLSAAEQVLRLFHSGLGSIGVDTCAEEAAKAAGQFGGVDSYQGGEFGEGDILVELFIDQGPGPAYRVHLGFGPALPMVCILRETPEVE